MVFEKICVLGLGYSLQDWMNGGHIAGLAPAKLILNAVNAWSAAGFPLLRLGASTARPLN